MTYHLALNKSHGTIFVGVWVDRRSTLNCLLSDFSEVIPPDTPYEVIRKLARAKGNRGTFCFTYNESLTEFFVNYDKTKVEFVGFENLFELLEFVKEQMFLEELAK